MDAAGLAHLEQACLHFYEGTDQVARNAAQQVLMSFGNDPAVVTKCRQIFDQSKSPYATTLAVSIVFLPAAFVSKYKFCVCAISLILL